MLNHFKKIPSVVGFILFVFVSAGFAEMVKLTPVNIKNPKPTHIEKEFSKLKIVKKITDNFSKQHFLAFPISIAVNKEGIIFVFDRLLHKIFAFDKAGNFLRVFGREGRGPGDIAKGAGGTFNKKRLMIGPTGNLLVSDCVNRKILEFDAMGTLIKEYPVKITASFSPVMDDEGNYYLPSPSMLGDALIDVYDKDNRRTHSLLKKNDMLRLLDYEPKKWMLHLLSEPHTTTIELETSAGNQLGVYIYNSSTFYLFKNRKFVRKFPLYPKKALEARNRRIEFKRERLRKASAEIKASRKGVVDYARVGGGFFIDGDTPDFFYLKNVVHLLSDQRLLYKFSIGGELIKVLSLEGDDQALHPLVKRNGLFYALSTTNIYILKEEG
ncbi:MAG: 6-bladed beta-propeller [bacterium]|nr:6-bladed beta-propeller [bacterium]